MAVLLNWSVLVGSSDMDPGNGLPLPQIRNSVLGAMIVISGQQSAGGELVVNLKSFFMADSRL